jgi:hypothetical protein
LKRTAGVRLRQGDSHGKFIVFRIRGHRWKSFVDGRSMI